MKGDGHIGGQKYLRAAGKTPQQNCLNQKDALRHLVLRHSMDICHECCHHNR